MQHIARRELLPLAFVGAALPEVDETLLTDRGMTFFQRCARARLLPLERSDTQSALRKPITGAGGRIDAGAIQPAGRGKVRFTHHSLRPWLRSQQ